MNPKEPETPVQAQGQAPLRPRKPAVVSAVPSSASGWRRMLEKIIPSRKNKSTRNTMLPVLIEVFAGFSKIDGEVEE